jgi:hypothetical protein
MLSRGGLENRERERERRREKFRTMVSVRPALGKCVFGCMLTVWLVNGSQCNTSIVIRSGCDGMCLQVVLVGEQGRDFLLSQGYR